MLKLKIGNKYAVIGNSNAIVVNTTENNFIMKYEFFEINA